MNLKGKREVSAIDLRGDPQPKPEVNRADKADKLSNKADRLPVHVTIINGVLPPVPKRNPRRE